MKAVSSISQIASLMADPKRSAMLWALIDGVARPAEELAAMTGLTASSVCAHLSLLSTGGLVRPETRGRKRYFRLATPEVGMAVEAMASVRIGDAPGKPVQRLPLDIPVSMRQARRCGEHLGGKLAADLYDRLVLANWLEGQEPQQRVGLEGRQQMAAIGVFIDALAPGAQRDCVICHCCEWSDQRPHLGGSLGQAFFKLFMQSGWIREHEQSRALRISAFGLQQINQIACLPTWQVG